MAQSGNDRQARWLRKQAALGQVPVTVIVPERAASDLRLIAEALRQSPELEIGPLRSTRSGRLISARRAVQS
jgi:hypothetical protein